MSDQNQIVKHEPQQANVVATKHGRGIAMMPRNGKGIMELAKMAMQSGVCPQFKTNEQAWMALAKGLELGLSPQGALESVAVINGKARIFGDAALSLVMASGELEDIEEGASSAEGGWCRVKRRGRASWTERTFTIDDAKRAALWGKGGPWSQYPQRMLQMRARSFALRDAFPDILSGIGIYEEFVGVDEGINTGGLSPEHNPMASDGAGSFRDGFSPKSEESPIAPEDIVDVTPEPEPKKATKKVSKKTEPKPEPEPEPEDAEEPVFEDAADDDEDALF